VGTAQCSAMRQPGGRCARSCRRNAHENLLVGRQILVGIESHGDSSSLSCLRMPCLRMIRLRLICLRMTRLETISRRSRGPQHPPTAAHRHTFRQSDFGGHGKSQFHDRSFGKRRLGVKKYSTAAQVLDKSGYSASLEMNRQCRRLMHLETLRRSPFQTIFKTIGICAHGHPSDLGCGGSKLYRGSNRQGSCKAVT